jgi:hypothetical protein
MKKRLAYYSVAVLAAAGLLFAAGSANQASGNQGAAPCGMMQGRTGGMRGPMANPGGMNDRGMAGMRGMMMAGLQNPVGRSMMMAFLLPEMKSELGLSSSQASNLNGLKQEFTSEGRKTEDQIAAARRDLNARFTSGKPDQSRIRKDASQIGKLEADRLLNGYQTAGRMKALLTPEQRSRLEAMSAAGLYDSMMSHMTVNQMGQMMSYMYGGVGAGMMSGGMGAGMTSCGMMGMMGGTMRNGMMHGQAAPQRP